MITAKAEDVLATLFPTHEATRAIIFLLTLADWLDC
jgi:hypothetical protein